MSNFKHIFAPRSRFLALEPRILFDGAAATAVEQQTPDASAHDAQTPVPRATLVVIDSRVNNAEQLAAEAGKDKSTQIVMVGNADDGLATISKALETAGRVDAIQIYSHGAAGQFTLGSRNISADNIATASSELGSWAAHLSADADVLLLGCNVGAGESGRALITQLAALTGADVAASSNDTGSASAGGDWALEVASGSIESLVPALAYEGLLANASPAVALSATTINTLLGGQFSFTATFTNTSAQDGYAPFVDVILPATGKDGAGAEIDDGITFVSASYLGQAIKTFVITFDASGNAEHPLAKDSTGQPVIVNAASYGAQAGDQLIVLQLPYASVNIGQPAIPVVITAQLSNLADTDGSPDLTVKVRGGFQNGNDSANNPTVDPSLFEGSMHSLVIHPTGFQVSQSVSVPEGETVTGPNFERSIIVTATPPLGQTLTNVDITQSLPDTIRIKSITPGSGGTISTITLGNGSLVSDPTLISGALAQSPFLSSYTVRYASLTAATNTVVEFYVPDKDAAGADILDPVSGDDRVIAIGEPTGTGQWEPLDTRDQTIDPGPPVTVVPETFTASGSAASFVAMSVALSKQVAIVTNVGNSGLSPGDTLQYTLNIDLSDYFAMGKTLFDLGNLTIVDQLGDGQQLIPGSPVLTIYERGAQHDIPLIATTSTTAGVTTLTLDIAQSLFNSNAISGGALIGDLAFDGDVDGPTRAVITYRSSVAQTYTSAYTQSEINEGDSIGNNATVSGTFLANSVSLTGESEADTSTASLTVATHNVGGSILAVNGSTPPADGELRPGDVVTFKLSYNLETGDYEQFKLSAFLPLPLFELTGLSLTQGSGPGQWDYGPGNTNVDLLDSVTVGAGNSLVFDFGSYANNPGTTGKRIEVQFTLTVGNQPFADQRALTVLGQSDQLTTIAHNHLVSSGAIKIASVAEPVLAITHGVVAVAAGSGGIVTGTTGTWAAAGSGGAPFTGSVTDLLAVEGSVLNIDGLDLVRLATAIENTGGLGAYDVATGVTLPADFSFSGGSLAAANLKVYRGDGTVLILNTDYSVVGTTITFLDAGLQPTLLPGRAGTANDVSGANIVIITYDVIAASTVAASQSLQTTATLSNWSSADGGPDFTPIDLTDTAMQTIAAPVIGKVFANGSISDDDSSATHTGLADLVIGESMLYDIVVNLPEGVTQNLRINDLIPPGMMLDTSFGTGGYQIITTTAGSGALSSDFAGTVTVASANAPGGDGGDLGLTLSAASATADNNLGNNKFVVRVRLIASNVIGNQTASTLANSAQLIYSDPDGDTPNGSTFIDRSVALNNSPPMITVSEPTIVLTQTYVITTGPSGDDTTVIKDDVVTYTFTLTNNSASGDFSAFDINFTDALPTLLKFNGGSLGLLSVTATGGATGVLADFEITGGANSVLQSKSGANIDIPKGGSITIVVVGQVLDGIGSVAEFSNTASVQWTSLDGTVGGERTGVDGLLNGGTLNDYRVEQTTTIKSAGGATLSHVGGMVDTLLPTPTDAPQTVAVGEIIRYRFAIRIIPGDSLSSNFIVALPDGLSFTNDGTTTVGLLGSSNSTLKWSDGGDGLGVLASNYFIVGGVTSRNQTLLPADPTTSDVTAVLNPSRINTSDPRAIKFTIGNLRNDETDGDAEVLYLEFNVRVANIPSVETTDSFAVVGRYYSDVTLLSTTNIVVENVVEPNLNGVQKTVTDFEPRPGLVTGIATVMVAFTNTGDGIAYEARLADSMTGGSNYSLSQIVIDGTPYLPGNLPAGVSVSTAGGIIADFSKVAVGANIQLIYTVEVPNTLDAAPTNAVLTWSSLPESFQNYLGSSVGVDSAPDGERLYTAQESAGLGIISGTLWDDTITPTSSTSPDGTRIANQIVTLTWAGIDGDLATTAGNRTYTATTDTNGNYHFGVLPSGNYQLDAPNQIIAYRFGGDTDNAAARIDSDGGTLGSVTVSGLGEGATVTANVGYVRDNDAPVNTMPAAQDMLEDATLDIDGIFVSDIDAGAGDLTLSLSVKHGALFLTTSGVTITAGALDSAAITIRGTFSALNSALDSLLYTPTANYNGKDTLTVTTNDLGNTGDNNGNLIPSELDDAKTDTDRLTINIAAVNDAPVGVDDNVTALEKGGSFNDIDGYPGVINVLKNDTDVDIATNADSLTVDKIGLGTGSPTIAVGGLLSTSVTAIYGTLSIDRLGNVKYVIDNNNAAVQALRLNGNTLSETFTYQLSDLEGLVSFAKITVTIHGANDTPVGVDDTATATEAGGVMNATPGIAATGNALTNDTDVDAYGETRNVTGIRYKKESASGVMTGVDATRQGIVAGAYGTLTMNYDGTYSYVVDENATAVQHMLTGDTLIEYFSYLVTDKSGDNDIAQIKITITGTNDNPVAVDDVSFAQAARVTNGVITGTPVNPIGNVLIFPTGVDRDVDRLNTLTTTGVRSGTEAAGGTLVSIAAGSSYNSGYTEIVSTNANGTLGTLRIGADGSFQYFVNSLNAAVVALNTGETLVDTFTYRASDSTNLTDIAQLTVTIRGVNNPPVAQDAFSVAIESGGIANGTPGVNPSGDATANDIDPEGGALSVVAVRTGAEAGSGTPGTVGTPLVGLYGSLTLAANGTYTYVIDNTGAAVQSLRLSTNTLTDTFTYTEQDSGGFQDTAQIVVEIRGQNDNPVAVDDAGTAVEAGGSNNATAGTNPSGNVLTNDTDVDGTAYGETKAVLGFRSGTEAAGSGTAGVFGAELRGSYGWLTLNADGSYSYRVDNAMAAVEALRTSGNTLSDSFTYTVIDALETTDIAQLTITIQGANDTPVGAGDTAIAVEAGGISNATAGTNPTGNVLTNDTDVDASDTKTVAAFTNSNLSDGTVGSPLAGLYGSLTLNADGSYSYVIDNANVAVQALRATANTLTEIYSYTMIDAAGAAAKATLAITIQGQNDAPVAANDVATAVEAGGVNNATPGIDPTGNVLTNDSDVDSAANGETRTVTGFTNSAATSGTVGSALVGVYGSLKLNADGSYLYAIDNTNPIVQALRTSGNMLIETYNYTMRDTFGATSTATLTITIHGANDAPVGINDGATATEAGGTSNATAGSDATGNVLTNDTDIDTGDFATLTVTAVNGDSINLGNSLDGVYGSLVLNADGSFTYVVDNSNTAVQALRLATETLSESFTYTLSDVAGATSVATLTIVIQGANDAPVGNNDIALGHAGISEATERDAVGNVLIFPPGLDTDVDNGDARTVSAIRTGTEAAGTGTAGVIGAALTGTYGALTLNADGSFIFEVDSNNATVVALTGVNFVEEFFTYSVVDSLGLTDMAQLRIIIRGVNDAPVAQDVLSIAQERGGLYNITPGINPTGDATINDLDPDGQPLEVFRIRTGTEVEGGTYGALNSALAGSYGSLTIAADGTYSYVVDNSNVAVQALRTPTQKLYDVFTYTIRDSGVPRLTDQAQIIIEIQGQNDTPIAGNDAGIAVEAGGQNNATPGSNATGNVLTNDSDVDSIANGEGKTVSAFANSASAAGTVGSTLAGAYGSLTLNANGSYTYVVDNSNVLVQALRTSRTTLLETYSYTMSDKVGATSTATLTITITGTNDTPVAANDIGSAVEAGGINNTTAGSAATGNVLDNDTDLDTVANGETKTVLAFINSANEAGIVGSALIGVFGSLTLNADGTYSYEIDNANDAVQALRLSSDTLTETYSYTMRDKVGATATATLTITIHGANDAPVAIISFGAALEAGGVSNASMGRDASGNVLNNDRDVDAGDTKTVSAFSNSALVSGTVGSALTGSYGSLTLNAEGTFTYVVDNANLTVQALRQNTNFLTENFTYTIRDTAGATSTAKLLIVIQGANDTPVAVDDTAFGWPPTLADGIPGRNPTGNVLTNDTDVDAFNETRVVSGVRTGREDLKVLGGPVGIKLTGTYGDLTLNADGSYVYEVDVIKTANLLPTDRVTDTFTYTVTDADGLSDFGQLVVTVLGRNNKPVAMDVTGTAVEAGGVSNGTLGLDANGDALTNDFDIDLHPLTVISVGTAGGTTGTIGSPLRGLYGTLTLSADGTYTYVVDNSLPAVEALRTPTNTLIDSFTYVESDPYGATAGALINITIQGANDNPIAANDSGLATDQSGPPVTTGNVLSNDSDVDSGDTKSVVGIRVGTKPGTGVAGTVGQQLHGLYGTLVINADGSYSYEIDMTNPDVLQAAGRGQVLSDVFTYAVGDTDGATDQAELRIALDIAAPYQGAPKAAYSVFYDPRPGQESSLLNFTPVVYVERAVDLIERHLDAFDRRSDGSRPYLTAWPEVQSISIGAGLGIDRDIFVHHAIESSNLYSLYDASIVRSRPGVVTLSADGVLPDDSLYTPDSDVEFPITKPVVRRTVAPSFSEQLQQSAGRVRPFNGLLRMASQTAEKTRRT